MRQGIFVDEGVRKTHGERHGNHHAEKQSGPPQAETPVAETKAEFSRLTFVDETRNQKRDDKQQDKGTDIHPRPLSQAEKFVVEVVQRANRFPVKALLGAKEFVKKNEGGAGKKNTHGRPGHALQEGQHVFEITP
ncbi:MAG: hypothetical protein M5R36_03350 [Deltaproteobacteria bacterium]|nr:hypothetical protein [Deltaproteobacteria bacterium]